MAVHSVPFGGGIKALRERFPDSAIIRPVTDGYLVFDTAGDAMGHPSSVPIPPKGQYTPIPRIKPTNWRG